MKLEDLEKLSDEEREKVFAQFAKEANGISDQIKTLMRDCNKYVSAAVIADLFGLHLAAHRDPGAQAVEAAKLIGAAMIYCQRYEESLTPPPGSKPN